MSLYGCQLWNFSHIAIMEKLFIAWRNCARRIFKLPSRTHRCLVHLICEDSSISVKLHKRFIKFFISSCESAINVLILYVAWFYQEVGLMPAIHYPIYVQSINYVDIISSHIWYQIFVTWIALLILLLQIVLLISCISMMILYIMMIFLNSSTYYVQNSSILLGLN